MVAPGLRDEEVRRGLRGVQLLRVQEVDQRQEPDPDRGLVDLGEYNVRLCSRCVCMLV